MTNYYNILGLEEDADLSEIKTAYRKLSKKFHPDLNPDDAFFGKMFLQVQEAYEVLSDEKSRQNYDAKRFSFFKPNTRPSVHQPIHDHMPVVENFSVDKDSIKPDEDFMVTWKVKNADFVQIRPLGVFPEEGFERFKFSKLKARTINLVLIATNTQTGLSARRHIELTNRKWHPSLMENDKFTNMVILILRILIGLVILTFFYYLITKGVTVKNPNEGY